MSRIHEALKKAQMERGGATRVEDAPPSMRHADVTEAPVAGPSAASSSGWQEGRRTGPIPIDVLDQHCKRPTWTPDPKIAGLMSASSSGMGTEELRTLRSRLYQIRDRQQPNLRKILVTSALPGDGKTFLTTSLGLMMARQHGRKVLLVDADLRRPQLHATLGAPIAPGLTDYLSGSADALDIVQRGVGSDLYFIPAGKTVPNPAELITGGLLGELIDRLAFNFDWVLLDSPPAVPLHDASNLADMCDGVLLVVRAAATPFDIAQKARAELQEKNVLGVILNQVDGAAGDHAYYYNYYTSEPADPQGTS